LDPPLNWKNSSKWNNSSKLETTMAFELAHFYFFSGLLLEIWNLAARKMTYLACKNVNHER